MRPCPPGNGSDHLPEKARTMPSDTLLLFALTVFPLVCSPGPDILFVASQGLCRGRAAARRATLGILAGYSVHALLAAFGIAALLGAWPPLLHAIRWTGLAYLLYLAWQMFRAASRPGSLRPAFVNVVVA